jgi:hypothetical protein
MVAGYRGNAVIAGSFGVECLVIDGMMGKRVFIIEEL